MEKKNVLLGLLAGVLVTGCASVGVQSSPTYMDADNGEKKHFIKVSMTDTSAFAPSTATSLVLDCKYLPETTELKFEDASDVEKMESSKCKQTMVNHDSGSGVAPAVLGAGSVVGAGYFVGQGLGRSGNSTNNTTNNGISTDNSSGGGSGGTTPPDNGIPR